MTTLDDLTNRLGARIDRLSPRAQVAFFATCADALAGTDGQSETLARAIRWARDVARDAPVDGQAVQLLEEVSSAAPEDDTASIAEGDAWVCADAAVRILAEPGTVKGSWVEYALEPLVFEVTEELYDVLQLGTEQEHLIGNVLAQPRLVEAIEFCDWALSLLDGKDTVSDDDLRQLAERASALVP